jgi:hypothetical protein
VEIFLLFSARGWELVPYGTSRFIRKEYTCETSNCCRSFRVARRQRARFLEQKRSAVIIQKFWRGARARKLFQQETSRIILLQSQVISMNILIPVELGFFSPSLFRLKVHKILHKHEIFLAPILNVGFLWLVKHNYSFHEIFLVIGPILGKLRSFHLYSV